MHTQKEAFQNLLRVLDAVPDDKFDIMQWANDCGTVACAAGWAAMDPWFREKGLTLKRDRFVGMQLAPEFRGEVGYQSLALFFGITVDDADQLFDGYAYRELEDDESLVDAIFEGTAAPITPREVRDRVHAYATAEGIL